MNLTKKHIQSQEVVGEKDGLPVSLTVTTGGLHLVFMSKNGHMESIGAGPHRAIALWMASKKEPGIKWISLRKNEETYTAEEVAGIVTLTLAELMRGKAK